MQWYTKTGNKIIRTNTQQNQFRKNCTIQFIVLVGMYAEQIHKIQEKVGYRDFTNWAKKITWLSLTEMGCLQFTLTHTLLTKSQHQYIIVNFLCDHIFYFKIFLKSKNNSEKKTKKTKKNKTNLKSKVRFRFFWCWAPPPCFNSGYALVKNKTISNSAYGFGWYWDLSNSLRSCDKSCYLTLIRYITIYYTILNK